MALRPTVSAPDTQRCLPGRLMLQGQSMRRHERLPVPVPARLDPEGSVVFTPALAPYCGRPHHSLAGEAKVIPAFGILHRRRHWIVAFAFRSPLRHLRCGPNLVQYRHESIYLVRGKQVVWTMWGNVRER